MISRGASVIAFNARLGRAALLAAFVILGTALCPAEIINPKPITYDDNENTQKIAVTLLELEYQADEGGMTIPEVLEDTGIAMIGEALVVDIATTPTKLTSDILNTKFNVAGTVIKEYFPQYFRMIVLVNSLDALHALADIEEVIYIKPQYLPRTSAGYVDSHAEEALKADRVMDEFMLDGFGQKVGVVSDSFCMTDDMRDEDTAPPLNQTGFLTGSVSQDWEELPPYVQILRDNYAYDMDEKMDEGAAMGELVHDLAPGAAMAFHTGAGGDAVLADGFAKLAQAGCTVVVDDIRYPDEPMYQYGIPTLQALDAIRQRGVTHLSAAGNDNALGIRQIYRDVNETVQETKIPPDGNDLHDWGGGNTFLPVTVPPDGEFQLLLQWNQPFSSVSPRNGAQMDLDLYVVELPDVAELGTTLYRGVNAQGDTDKPMGDAFEMQDLIYRNDSGAPQTVYIAVDHFQGRRFGIPQNTQAPIEFRLVFWRHTAGISVPLAGPTIWGHAAAENIISVGAVPWYDIPDCEAGAPFATFPEPFTSKGGLLSFQFNNNGDYTFREFFRPVIASVDGTNTSFFGDDDTVLPWGIPYEPDGDPNFFGTSAAAANAAGVAALVRQANSTKRVEDALAQTACDIIGAPATVGQDDVTGYGVIDAYRAVASANTGTNLTLINPGWMDRVIVSQEEDAWEDGEVTCAGTPVYVNFCVGNTGTRMARGKFFSQVLVDGKAVGMPRANGRGRANTNIRMGPLDVGETEEIVNFNVGVLAPGTHTIEVVVDSRNRVKETNESDNRYTKWVTVGTAGANDNFANATPLPPTPVMMTGSNACATKEAGEPAHAGNAGGASVWFRWTPSVSDEVAFNTMGSGFDTLLAVYTGGSVGALTPVVSNDNNAGGITSRVAFNAVAGTMYFIAIDGKNGAMGNYVLNFEGHPGNDAFSAAYTLGQCAGGVTGTNVLATEQPGEPDHNGNPGGSSVWYRWTATTTGTVTFTLAANFTTLLAVYTGSAVNSLMPVVAGENFVTFATPPGVQYYIAVDGVGGSEGSFTLSWTSTVHNDMLADRLALDGCTGSVTGVNTCASKETGEPNHANNAGGKSLWYSWVSPFTTQCSFDTSGSNFDTLLGVYTGSAFGSLTYVAGNDNVDSSVTSKVTFNAQAGTEYVIAVDGRNGAAGSLRLSWTPAHNDDFSSRLPLSGCTGSTTATNVCATKQVGEPNHNGDAGGASLWWDYTAASSGQVTFSTAGSTFNTVLGAYTGSAVGSLTLVTSGTSSMTFSTMQGSSYKIAIDGQGGTAGTVLLTWSSRPVNDNFANATAITLTTTGTASVVTTCATKQTSEPQHADNDGGRSVWYMYAATSETSVSIRTQGSAFDTLLAVYVGASVDSLTSVTANNNVSGDATWSRVEFKTTTGTIYMIAVDGVDGASGSAVLNWQPVSSGSARPTSSAKRPAAADEALKNPSASEELGAAPMESRPLAAWWHRNKSTTAATGRRWLIS